jgi:hypothetical protein
VIKTMLELNKKDPLEPKGREELRVRRGVTIQQFEGYFAPLIPDSFPHSGINAACSRV